MGKGNRREHKKDISKVNLSLHYRVYTYQSLHIPGSTHTNTARVLGRMTHAWYYFNYATTPLSPHTDTTTSIAYYSYYSYLLLLFLSITTTTTYPSMLHASCLSRCDLLVHVRKFLGERGMLNRVGTFSIRATVPLVDPRA
jgi:hypothetical protein